MLNSEINAGVARKLFPGNPVVMNGNEVWCKDRTIDFRKPHLLERMLHELETVKINKVDGQWVVNGKQASTMSKAVALAYVHA